LCKSSDFKASKENGSKKKEENSVILGMKYCAKTCPETKIVCKTLHSHAKMYSIYSEQVKSAKSGMPYNILYWYAWCTWCIKIKGCALLENENKKIK